MARGDGIENQIKRARGVLHRLGVRRRDEVLCAGGFGLGLLGVRTRNRGDLGAERGGDFYAHLSQAPEPRDADSHALSHAERLDGIKQRDTGTHKRRARREVIHALGNLDRES